MTVHSAIQPGSVAVVTGAASGIGLAAAKRFASLGLKVCLADLKERDLEAAAGSVAELAPAGAGSVLAVVTDVSRPDDLRELQDRVRSTLGEVAVLMNNAGIQPGSSMFGPDDAWRRVIEVNLWGVIDGSRIFAPAMVASGRPGLIINTGSKQGITTPPGDPAYNVSKAGVKVFTEALQHELRNTPGCTVTAHLLIPGFVFTPLTAHGRSEKPSGAWTPERTVEFMLDGIAAGDFYILCPDNEVDRALDERRIAWSAADVIENRPPLSRWHPDFAAQFEQFRRS